MVVPTDNIKSGQVLAEEVRDINGRLLLSKGHTIEAKHIRIFKIWGISEVNLAETGRHDDTSDPLIDPAMIEQTKKKR
jgi:hypothetical protein